MERALALDMLCPEFASKGLELYHRGTAISFMDRNIIGRKLVKSAFFAAATAVIVATIGFNLYLMGHRPIVARVIPDTTPGGWICQRVFIDSYCVAITRGDQLIYKALVTLMLVFAVPVVLILGFLRQFRSTDDA